MMMISAVFVAFAVLGLSFGSSKAEATNNITSVLLPTEGSAEWLRTTYTRKQLAAITRQFTNYYLYFGEFTNTVRDNGGLPVGLCFPKSYSNTTHKLLSTAMTTSVRRAFVNRVLTRDQISWKDKSDKKSKKVNSSGNGTAPDSTDGTNSSTLTPSESETQNSEENEKNKNNKIHNHLIFVMLLPNHPYSQELRKIITTVSPMFPQTTVVLGNAYEFKDMTTKYYVTSYPKILYFKAGIYQEAFEGVYSAEEVAAQFADWTYSLPQAIPVPFEHTKLAYRTANTIRKLNIYAPDGHMRLGLALHPLPLTVPYTLLNVTVPAWLAAYLPLSCTTSNNATLTSLNTSSSATAVASHEINTTSAAASNTFEYMNNTGMATEESITSVVGDTESLPAPTPTVSRHTNTLTKDSTQADSTTTDSSIEQPHNIDPSSPAPDSSSTDRNDDITIQLSIVVPMPNMEPFLGSLENYAAWDTRMFLLAGTYVIIRVFYLLLKWVRGLRV